MLDCERDSLGASLRLERSHPGGLQHVAGELEVLLVVVDDQDERFHGRILSPWRSASCSPRITTSSAKASGACWRRGPTSRSRPSAATSTRCWPRWTRSSRTSSSPTSACLRAASDEGIQAAERLRESNPDVGVVVLSQYANPGYALALLEQGSAGRAYLLKEGLTDIEPLEAAIREVADGGSVIDPKVVDALVAEKARGEESPLSQLTPRERDVLREMAEGKNNAAIAAALHVTERSVEKVIHSIFLKLGLTWEPAVNKRVKAVILYLAESA